MLQPQRYCHHTSPRGEESRGWDAAGLGLKERRKQRARLYTNIHLPQRPQIFIIVSTMKVTTNFAGLQIQYVHTYIHFNMRIIYAQER